MNASFQHFLITRYNVPLEGWEHDKAGITTLDNGWLEHRLELFKKYCLPSIAAQTEKSFSWLIYCGHQTPESHLEKLRACIAPMSNATIRLTEGYHECLADIDITLTMTGTAYVITSRLDNDDALGVHYIKTIQKNFIPQNGLILNLLHGHGYHVPEKVATQLIKIRNNHFTSLIEEVKSNGGHTSIRGFQHDQPPSHFVIMNLNEKNSWLKIFHERNLKSSIFGYPVLFPNFKRLYGVDPVNAPYSFVNTLFYCFFWLINGFKRKVIQPIFKK